MTADNSLPLDTDKQQQTCAHCEGKLEWTMNGYKHINRHTTCMAFGVTTAAPAGAVAGQWQVLHDGPSRPILETADGRWLSLSQFEKGRWESYEEEESDCALVATAVNSHDSLLTVAERLAEAVQHLIRAPLSKEIDPDVHDVAYVNLLTNFGELRRVRTALAAFNQLRGRE